MIKTIFKKILNAVITWEGMLTIPALVLIVVFCAEMIQAANPNIGIFPAQYLQEIVYKLSVLVIGSNFIQFGIYFNLMLFFKFTSSDLKTWFNELTSSQKFWVVVTLYALYYLVYALVRL